MTPTVKLLMTSLALALIPASAFVQEADVNAREKLVGVWIGYAVLGNGEKPDQGPVKLELTITKDAIHAIGYKGKERMDLGTGAFALTLDKTPRHLDGDKKLANPNRKELWLGIYELDGDTFKWCVRKKGRPTEFETKDGAFLLILKRKT